MLWYFRILIFYTIISIFSLAFFLFICLPVHYLINASYDFRYKCSVFYSYVYIYLLWFIVGIKYEVEGIENLPPDTPYIVLSNHQSFWENFFMQLIIPKHSWIVKKELFNIPVFGWFFKMINPIAVDRSDKYSIIKITAEGKKRLANDISLIIFPEGTRIKPDREVKFKVGLSKLVIEAKKPVVLMVLNSGVFWPKGILFKQPGTIKVKIFEVIPPQSLEKFEPREFASHIQEKINHEKKVI
ncbi:MAG: 1-acyl-sn-glycerol-3-phosphate acyltransferase [Rickettsiaceae bacterium]|nr:1-acyl-sn-glycerol-3-phosphate acyltransferase [Rickettsiaceae bacterium]